MKICRLLFVLLILWPGVLLAETYSGEVAAFDQRGDLLLPDFAVGDARRIGAEVQRVVSELEALLDPAGSINGGLGQLNAAAGGAPLRMNPRVLALLAQSAAFCQWTNGATSLLGGHLYALWGLRIPVAALPSGLAIEEATDASACTQLVVNLEQGSASLAAGSRLEAWGFALGAAVDAAMETLEAQGVKNGFVSLGMVARGFGPGPTGGGWPIHPPTYPGLAEPLADIHLRDRALAAASPEDGRLGAAGEWFAPYLDLRSGRPTEGTVVVLASAQLAVEAQALATAMFVIGSRAGQMRLGNLSPRPSVLWILGSGEGRPLLVEYRWAELLRPAPKLP